MEHYKEEWHLTSFLNLLLKIVKRWKAGFMHLLRITLYQMVYLDKIPDRAAIYEAVEIAKKRGHKGIAVW